MSPQQPNHEPTPEPKDAASLWHDIEQGVRSWYWETLHPEQTAVSRPSAQPKDPSLDPFVEQERLFFVRVLETVRRAAERGEPIDIYFDVDGTIATRIEEKNDLVRPSFLPLLEQIYREFGNGRVKIGLLTTRRVAEQTEMVRSHDNYSDFQTLVGRIPIIYVRDEERLPSPANDLLSVEQRTSYLTEKQAAKVLEPMTDQQFTTMVAGLHLHEPEKIAWVPQLRAREPTHTLVIVDDLSYPSYLDETQGIFGISLCNGNGDLGKFFFRLHFPGNFTK